MVCQRVMTTATAAPKPWRPPGRPGRPAPMTPACGPRPPPRGGARAVDRHNLKADLRQVRNDWVLLEASVRRWPRFFAGTVSVSGHGPIVLELARDMRQMRTTSPRNADV